MVLHIIIRGPGYSTISLCWTFLVWCLESLRDSTFVDDISEKVNKKSLKDVQSCLICSTFILACIYSALKWSSGSPETS